MTTKLFRNRTSCFQSDLYSCQYIHTLISIKTIYPFCIYNVSFPHLHIVCYYLVFSSLEYSNSLLTGLPAAMQPSKLTKAQILLKLPQPPLFSKHTLHPQPFLQSLQGSLSKGDKDGLTRARPDSKRQPAMAQLQFSGETRN